MKCFECKKEFTAKTFRKYCSKLCRVISKCRCTTCGVKYTPNGQANKFCSDACRVNRPIALPQKYLVRGPISNHSIGGPFY